VRPVGRSAGPGKGNNMAEDKKESEQEQEIADVQDLVAKASKDLGETRRQEASIKAGEAVALEKLVDLLRPIMRLIGKPLPSGKTWGSGRNGCHPFEKTEPWERGIVLVDEFSEAGDGSGSRGTLVGTRLVLTRKEELLQQTRTGTWSHEQGETNHWESTCSPLRFKEAVKKYVLEDILKGVVLALNEALEGARGKRQQLEWRRVLLSRLLEELQNAGGPR